MPNIRTTNEEEKEESASLLNRNAPELEDGELELPQSIISTAWAARIIYEQVRESHIKRARGYARIQGMVDGNAPYPKAAQVKAGQIANSNVNFRDGESWHESVTLVFWSLFNDVQYLAEFETSIGDPKENPSYERIVAEKWDELMRDWPDFAPVMEENQADFILYGIGPLFWPDERDWRFESIDIFRFLVPEKTRNSSGRFGMAMIEHILSVHEIVDIIEHANEGRGWDKEILKEILVRKFQNDSTDKKQYSGQEYAALQARIRNGDLQGDERYNDDILVVSIFIREYDGKVSRGIFDPSFVFPADSHGNPDPRTASSPGWMFFREKAYQDFNEALFYFTFTPGQKFFHGNKGLGHKIFNIVEGQTQIENSLMDSVRRSSMIIVSSKNTRNKGLPQIHFSHGGVVDVGEAEFKENLMGSNFNSSVQAVQYFDNKLQRNNSISGTSMSTPDGKPRTAGEMRMQVTREARVQKNKIAHYYRQCDALFIEVLRKQLHSKPNYPGYEEVQEFKEKCIAEGVPAAFFDVTPAALGANGLPKHLKIRATRAAGSGSQVADQIEMEGIMKLLPTLGQRGRVNVLKDYIAATRGHRYIPRYFPPEDQSNDPVADDTIASLENNQLEKGEMVIVSPDNKHAVHAPRHLERMKQIAQAYQQAEDAAKQNGSKEPARDAEKFGQYGINETDIAFQTIGPHFVRHLLMMSQDPVNASLVDSLRGQWAILANFGDKIANNAQEIRDKDIRTLQTQKQQQAQLPMDQQIKMAQVQSDHDVKLQKLILENERASKRDQLQYMLKRQEVSFKAELDAREAERKAAKEAAIQPVSEEKNNTGKEAGELY